MNSGFITAFGIDMVEEFLEKLRREESDEVPICIRSAYSKTLAGLSTMIDIDSSVTPELWTYSGRFSVRPPHFTFAELFPPTTC